MFVTAFPRAREAQALTLQLLSPAGPRPKTKEAAIVMLADVAEGAVRSLSEVTATRIEAVIHNMAMRRLQDGQFYECDISLRELSLVEASMTKTLAAHYHGRIAYPKPAHGSGYSNPHTGVPLIA